MTRRLPSRSFREVQLLIGAALVILVAVAVIELQGILSLSSSAVQAARRDLRVAAKTVAVALATRPNEAIIDVPVEDGDGLAVVMGDKVVARTGSAGPLDPVWWPWRSRAEWERSGRATAGPLGRGVDSVLVAYEPVGGGRIVRVVRRVPEALISGRWPWLAGLLALAVAGGGALLAWIMLGRALGPYRELLEEATRIGAPGEESEDRFLVDTFRATISRMEASEAELRRRADELALLSDVLTRGSETGVVVLDRDGRVRASNRLASELLGVELAPGAVPPLPATAPGTLELGGRWLEIASHPLLFGAGDRQGEVLFVADRSRERALERMLHEHEQLAGLGELAAGLAHELRNGMATITGYLRLVDGADSADRDRYLAAISAEADAIGELVQRFLSFAQPQQLHPRALDLRALALERSEAVSSQFHGVTVAIESDEARAVGDPLALAVALDNLIRNACEAVQPHGGRVVIRGGEGAEGAWLSVEDDGPGVAPEMRETLFVPFASTKPSGGLGLAMARRLARLHGGDVTYADRAGTGSVFTLTVPGEAAG